MLADKDSHSDDIRQGQSCMSSELESLGLSRQTYRRRMFSPPLQIIQAAYLPPYLPIYLPTYLPYLLYLTYLPTYLPTYLSTYLPTYLRT